MTAKQKLKDTTHFLATTFKERPFETVGAAIGVAVATTKLLTATNEYRNSKTWKREVKRRERNSL